MSSTDTQDPSERPPYPAPLHPLSQADQRASAATSTTQEQRPSDLFPPFQPYSITGPGLSGLDDSLSVSQAIPGSLLFLPVPQDPYRPLETTVSVMRSHSR